MIDKLVCDIGFYLYLRFIFGFYHNFERSKPVQWLARCYCFFLCVNIIIWMISYCNNVYPLLPTVLSTAEYLLYVLISFWKNNQHILRYYKKKPLIDDVTNVYQPMRLYLMVYMTLVMLAKIAGFVKYLSLYWINDPEGMLFAFLELIAWCSNVVGRSLTLFIFGLLYFRVSSMRKMLESNDLQCRSQVKHPRRYIHMYEAIFDDLEKTDDAVKMQLFVSIFFSTAFFSYQIFFNLFFIRTNSELVSTFNVVWFTMEILLGCSPLCFSAILLDMVTVELEDMLVIVVKKRIACTNERDRAEMQQLFQLLKDRPFQYSLWRMFPLSLYSLMSLLTFCITSVIAIIQIKDWFK